MDRQETDVPVQTGTSVMEPLLLLPEQRVFSEDEVMSADMFDIADDPRFKALISEILREELQGALGERMTRNMRKLVRREIARALAANDLD